MPTRVLEMAIPRPINLRLNRFNFEMSCFANALNYIPHKRINYKTLLSVTMFVIPTLPKEIGLFVHVIQKGFSLYPCDVVSGCIHFYQRYCHYCIRDQS